MRRFFIFSRVMRHKEPIVMADEKPAMGEEKPAEIAEQTAPATVESPEQIAAELAKVREALKAANKDAEQHRKKLNEAEAKQKAEEEERARKQGEFEQLATKVSAERDAVRAELDAANEKLARYAEIVAKDVDSRIAQWPDEVRLLVPNGDTDVLQRVTEAQKLEPLARKLMDTGSPRGAAPSPMPSNGPSEKELEDTRRAQEAVSRRGFG